MFTFSGLFVVFLAWLDALEWDALSGRTGVDGVGIVRTPPHHGRGLADLPALWGPTLEISPALGMARWNLRTEHKMRQDATFNSSLVCGGECGHQIWVQCSGMLGEIRVSAGICGTEHTHALFSLITIYVCFY